MPSDVVLLHGFTQTGAAWQGVERELGSGWRSAAPDLAGHGERPLLGAVTFAGEAAMIDALAPPSFVLCGYSMGGRLALYYALRRPERVTALVLVGASPGIADPAERAERRRADNDLADSIEARPLEDFAREWGAQPLFAGQPRHVEAAAYADRMRNTPAGLAAALRGLGTGVMPSLWGSLRELRQPVILVVGERDQKFLRIADRMARMIEWCRVMTVPGAGHAVHLERPVAVAQAIEQAVGMARR